MINRLLREPLLHFFLLGVALFALYGWLNVGGPGAANEIVVSRGQLESLQAQFERVWQRPPTSQELQGLVDTWVREEIFYREGMAMGLDRDDPVVRRRIAQKIEFIIDAATPPPTTEGVAELAGRPPRQYLPNRRIHSAGLFRSQRHAAKLEPASEPHAPRSHAAIVGRRFDDVASSSTGPRPKWCGSSVATSSTRCGALPVGGWSRCARVWCAPGDAARETRSHGYAR